MKIAYILLNFDQLLTENDNRFEIVWGEYGFKATAVVRPETESHKQKLSKAGWEISAYNNTEGEYPPHEERFDMSEQSLKKWCAYVKAERDRLSDLGVYPTTWACRQNRFGPALEYALKQNGFLIARGQRNPDGTSFIKEFKEGDMNTPNFEIYSHNIDEVKRNIDYAVEHKCALNIFTHLVVKTPEEDKGFDCVESTYREMLDYVKQKADAGLCEVITYKEFYDICKKEW